MYGLIDCNNFYVSCERIFRPRLIDRPVIVLSNNDGCIISRSAEAKKLGIPMGIPLFKIKDLIQREGVEVCSSNYELYGDISQRIMRLIRAEIPTQEVYSIDECFVHFNVHDDYTRMAHTLRQKILKGVGVPTCVGVGPTKTLAKLANHVAKRNPETHGVRVIDHPLDLSHTLRETTIDDVWGVGRRGRKKMFRFGIQTAYDFIQRSPQWVAKNFTIVGLDTYYELMGYPRLSFGEQMPTKSMLRSRSFGHPIESKDDLQAVLMQFADTICTELQEQFLMAGSINVFVASIPINSYSRPYVTEIEVPILPDPTAHLTIMAPIIRDLLHRIYRPGLRYKKAGIQVSNLSSQFERLEFYDPEKEKLNKLLSAQKEILSKHGRYSVHLASFDPNILSQSVTRNHTSQAYTTKWNDLLTIKVHP